eukprot:1651312-Amphidinium_carterae.1
MLCGGHGGYHGGDVVRYWLVLQVLDASGVASGCCWHLVAPPLQLAMKEHYLYARESLPPETTQP